MILELENFRGIEKLKLEVVDSELTLLNGDNAAGKTTILDAIGWILYGTTKKKVYPKSKPKTKVKCTLHINRVIITRTANPGSLELNLGSTTFIGDEASAYIEENYGKHNLWKVSCCVDNNDINNFLLSSNTQRMDLLNSIAFGDTTPSIYIDKIEDEIKQIKQDIRVKEEVADTRKKDYEKLLKHNKDYDEDDTRSKKELKLITNEIKEIREIIPNVRELWTKFERQNGEFVRIEADRDKLTEELNSLKGTKPEKIKKYSPSEELNQTLIVLSNNETYTKRIKELKTLTHDAGTSIFKNDDKLLGETRTRLELIRMEKEKCGDVEYNKQAINMKIKELEAKVSISEGVRKRKEYQTLRNQLQEYYSTRYYQLQNMKHDAELYSKFELIDKYRERMELVDMYMNYLRDAQIIYKHHNPQKRQQTEKLGKMKQDLEAGQNYLKKKQYDEFVEYKDYLEIKHDIETFDNLMKIYDLRTDPSKFSKDIESEYTLEEIRELEEKNNQIKTELPDIQAKITKKKYRLKGIEEAMSIYSCPHCDGSLSLDAENNKLVVANVSGGNRSRNKEDADKIREELASLTSRYDKLKTKVMSTDTIQTLYHDYVCSEIERLDLDDLLYNNNRVESVDIPVGYNPQLIPSLIASISKVPGKEMTKEQITKLERDIMKLQIELGNTEEDSEDEVETPSLDTLDMNNQKEGLKRVSKLLSQASIDMEDIPKLDLDQYSHLTLDEIEANVEVLKNCSNELALLDELEEAVESEEAPEKPDININAINKEMEKIEALGFDLSVEIRNATKSKAKPSDDIRVQNQYSRMLALEEQLEGLDIDMKDLDLDELDPTEQLNNLKSLTVYELPQYDCAALEKSLNMRKYVEELNTLKKKIEDIDVSEDIGVLKKRYEICKKYEEDVRVYETKLDMLSEKLQSIKEVVQPVRPEQDLKELEARLDTLLNESEKAIKANVVYQAHKDLKNAETDLRDLQVILADQIRLKDVAVAAQCEKLDNLINRINKNVNILLAKLIDETMVFEIKLYKELKTTGAKKQCANIQITKGVEIFDNVMDICSGQTTMICIALTLVFNSMLKCPLILFDETLAKLSEEWKEEAIKCINNHAMGKTVLCTIHGGSKGLYKNIIDIPCDGMKYVEGKL